MKKSWKKRILLGAIITCSAWSASAARSEWAIYTYLFDDGTYAGATFYPCEGRAKTTGTVTSNVVIDSGPCGVNP